MVVILQALLSCLFQQTDWYQSFLMMLLRVDLVLTWPYIFLQMYSNICIQETYMSQNNFKSSYNTTRNWRTLRYTAILSCWRHFCMLRLSKNSFPDDSAHELLMIPRMNFVMFDDSAHKFWRMIMQVQH